jgi:hypothetical protein
MLTATVVVGAADVFNFLVRFLVSVLCVFQKALIQVSVSTREECSDSFGFSRVTTERS